MCKNGVRWLYRLERSYTWSGGFPVDSERLFFDKAGHLRLVIAEDGAITVVADYSWNGCSPKLCVFDILLGTPDGVVHAKTGRPKTYFASMVHDALYQFLPEGLPYTRKQADEIFLRLMAESDFAPRRLYWAAVRLFGWILAPALSRVREHAGTSVTAAALVEDAAS